MDPYHNGGRTNFCPFKARAIEIGIGKIGATECGIGEIGITEIDTNHIRQSEVGPGEIGPGEIGAGKIETRKVLPAQGHPGKVQAGQIFTGNQGMQLVGGGPVFLPFQEQGKIVQEIIAGLPRQCLDAHVGWNWTYVPSLQKLKDVGEVGGGAIDEIGSIGSIGRPLHEAGQHAGGILLEGFFPCFKQLPAYV